MFTNLAIERGPHIVGPLVTFGDLSDRLFSDSESSQALLDQRALSLRVRRRSGPLRFQAAETSGVVVNIAIIIPWENHRKTIGK